MDSVPNRLMEVIENKGKLVNIVFMCFHRQIQNFKRRFNIFHTSKEDNFSLLYALGVVLYYNVKLYKRFSQFFFQYYERYLHAMCIVIVYVSLGRKHSESSGDYVDY